MCDLIFSNTCSEGGDFPRIIAITLLDLAPFEIYIANNDQTIIFLYFIWLQLALHPCLHVLNIQTSISSCRSDDVSTVDNQMIREIQQEGQWHDAINQIT